MQIAESYDRMPYPNKFFYLTSPDHLGTVATLFGIDPAPPQDCRVLELGCGNGSNLLAHAFTLPGSEFVGIDISKGHIHAANASAKELDVSNVTFAEMDVTKMTEDDFGKFDYIIGHGLISWIPVDVRDRIFGVCGELLEENGIGFLSYNVYPGAYSREMVRDILKHHTDSEEDIETKVRNSIGLLGLLAEGCIETKVIKQTYKREFERHLTHDVADFYHDDLNENYHPLYFKEFAAHLDGAGLKFFSEAEFHSMSLHPFSPEVRELIGSMDDLIEREQYLDYFRGRAFRQSMFCRKGIELDYTLPPSRLEGMLLATSLMPDKEPLDLSQETKVKFSGNRKQGIEIDHPLTKAILAIAGSAWGRALPFAELVQQGRQTLESAGVPVNAPEHQEATAAAIILRIYQGSDLVELHLCYPEAGQDLSDRPKLNRLSRWQVGSSKNLTSLFGLNVRTQDLVSTELLRLADGTRTLPALTSAIRQFIESSEDIEDPEELLGRLDSWVDESLRELAKLGMFES